MPDLPFYTDNGTVLHAASYTRVDRSDEALMELHNKCFDCCDVIGCHMCGPCPTHDDAQEG